MGIIMELFKDTKKRLTDLIEKCSDKKPLFALFVHGEQAIDPLSIQEIDMRTITDPSGGPIKYSTNYVYSSRTEKEETRLYLEGFIVTFSSQVFSEQGKVKSIAMIPLVKKIEQCIEKYVALLNDKTGGTIFRVWCTIFNAEGYCTYSEAAFASSSINSKEVVFDDWTISYDNPKDGANRILCQLYNTFGDKYPQ